MNASGSDLAARAFVQARAATARSGFVTFARRHGAAPGDARLPELRGRFDKEPLLLDPTVRRVSSEVIGRARGATSSTTTWTVWPHIKATLRGWCLTASWLAYCAWHSERSCEVHAKGDGQVYAPVSTTDHVRLSTNVTAVHQLVLDCDGTGSWEDLVAMLDELGYSVIVHETGGSSAEVPKWRLVLPLDRPFILASATDRVRWRSAYATARTVLGSIAGLTGFGFDPATDTVCHAWFPGYARSRTQEPRLVTYRDGTTLKLDVLTASFPALEQPMPLGAEFRDSDGESFLTVAFREAGMLGRPLGGGKYAVRCPWNDCHSAPLPPGADPTSASVIFPAAPASGTGSFYCSHSSCGFRLSEDVLGALPQDAVQRAWSLRELDRSESPSISPGGETPGFIAGLGGRLP